ncbi:MAG: glycosyltransferase family 4 protein [Flavobacteriales bacterium]|nr:glycosyltransferase family 4 protein [Flavobacteriales bacterium]
MKILFLSDGIFPYVIGGMQKHSRNLVRHLGLLGHDITLVHQVDHDAEIPEYEHVRNELFGDRDHGAFESICLKFGKNGKIPGHYIRNCYRYSAQIYSLIESRLAEFDFIYVKGFSGWKLLEERNNLMFDCPKIGVKFHGYEMFQMSSGLKNKLEHLMLRHPVLINNNLADYIFSYGGKISTLLTERLKLNPNKIIEIPSAIDEDWLFKQPKKDSDKLKVLFVGRYERRKGLIELHEALRKFEGQNIEFSIAGSVPDSVRLEQANVIYHGKVSDEKAMMNLYRTCDVFICPSYSEGMPNTILEAMASKCAIIATDVGANRKMVNHENGWLLEKVSVENIEIALQAALESNKESLSKMQLRSLQRIEEEFLWTKIAEKTSAILESST